MKKGLGRIPKSLSWIDEEIIHPTPEVSRKEQPAKDKQEKKAEAKVKSQPEIIQQNLAVKIEEESSTSSANSCKKGLPEGWTRATFIISQELNEKIKDFAYWERVTAKDIMHAALSLFFEGKSIKTRPKNKPTLIYGLK